MIHRKRFSFCKAWKKYKGTHSPSWSRSDRIVKQRLRNAFKNHFRR